MHFHLGPKRGGRVAFRTTANNVICQRRQNKCTDLGAEIHGLAGRSRRGGRLSYCLEEQKELIKEAFMSGEEKRTSRVDEAVIIRLAVSD